LRLNYGNKGVGIVGWTILGSNPDGAQNISLLRNVQTGYEAHQAFYSIGNSLLSFL